MNDKLIMENYLLILKSTIEVYVHGTLESSNNSVRKTLKYGLDQTIKHQANTYDEMVEFNWYKVSNVDKKAIKQTLEKIKNSN